MPAWAGGGWVPGRGASYLETSILFATTDEAYDKDGQIAPFGRVEGIDRPTTYRDLAFVVYGEVGLGGALALEGDVAMKHVDVEEPATLFSNGGPADLRLALKRGWRAGPWALAASLGGRFGLGYDTADYPSLGAGGSDVFASGHVGLGFTRGWAQAEAGLRTRHDPARNEWPFAAQVGYEVFSRWTVVADLRGHGLLGPKDPGTTLAVVPGPEIFDPARASSSIVQAGPALTYAVTPAWHVSAQGWHSLSGRNVPSGWKWKLALANLR